MTELKCQNCRESFIAREARFCPYCGSSSVSLVIKESLAPFTESDLLGSIGSKTSTERDVTHPESTADIDPEDLVEEEEKPRRHSKR